MYILNDLWQGNITPSERYIRSGTEYQKPLHELSGEINGFINTLPSEKQVHYEKLTALQYKLNSISEQDAFIVGFRLGAKMIIDVMTDYKGQFKTPANI